MRENESSLNRRQFLTSAGAAALTFTVVSPSVAFGSQANAAVNLGLIGCGGRGSWIASLFEENGGFKVTAVADYFKDRAIAAGTKFKVDSKNVFTGLDAYKQMLQSGAVDAIAIESPPYFHPEQAAAGVDAGKHVYLAKPIAVDVPGCRTVEESGKKARQKKLAYLIDFQTRANPLFIEALKRVHAGHLGKFAFGESQYLAGSPWEEQVRWLESDASNAENRLRAWGLDRALSGDILVEQNIHTIDVMNWIMGTPPLYAVGTGGRKVRGDKGNVYDHFSVLYQYPDDVGINFNSRQFEGHGAPEGILNKLYGSKGILETNYFGDVLIRSKENPYPGGKTGGIYRDAVVVNIARFHEQITKGDYANETIEPSVLSNMISILGRTAGYEKRIVKWEEITSSTERLVPEFLGGLRA